MMFERLKKLLRDRRGNALLVAGAALPLLIGSAGLAADTIQWVLWQRQLQRAADSAAEAGVYAKLDGRAVGACADISGATYNQPVAWDLKKNSHLAVFPVCTVTNPPPTGAYAVDDNAVKVDLSYQKPLSFSGMFLSAAPTINVSATATLVGSGEFCVISLESTSTTGVTATGSSQLQLGCGIATNSTSLSSAFVASGSARVNASPISAVGGISGSSNWGPDTVLQPFNPAQDDPFAAVNAPASTTYPATSCPSLAISGGTKTTLTLGTDYQAMSGTSTGYYCMSSITLSGGNTTLPSGVYVIDGGNFAISGNASLQCSGCTFVMTNRNSSSTAAIGTTSISGGGVVNISSPSTGTYRGIAIYEDRRASLSQQDWVTGNSTTTLEGALYMPSRQVNFTGSSGMHTDCFQMVARRITFTGNMNLANSCTGSSGASAFDGKKVRLVA